MKQLEQLAWIPFFGCVGKIAQIVFSVLGLAFLHWSLVVFSVITAVVLWLSPKLFQKKLELLGQNCGVQQTAAINHLKDLLTGFDVLQFFGRGNLFLQQGNRISDDIEKPRLPAELWQISHGGVDWLYQRRTSARLACADCCADQHGTWTPQAHLPVVSI